MTDTPHILIALHQLGSGGVERVTLHLANGLAARGNQVTLALLRGDGVLQDRLDPAVKVVMVGQSAPSTRGPGLLRSAQPLARIIRQVRPTLLLSPGNHMHPLVLLARNISGVRDCRLALKFTNPVERQGAGGTWNKVRRAFFRQAAAQADLILMLSPAARDQAAELCPTATGKIAVVDNPYIDEGLLDRSHSTAEKDKPPLLLSVGRLTDQKDPLMLIEAVAGLADRPWRLVILGEGPLRGDCEARVEALGLADRVELAGFVADPSGWFERASVFLLASRYEELPAVLFEAMVGRCAIVATAASQSVVELLDAGRLGKIVPPGDAEAFRGAIAATLDDPPPIADVTEHVRRFTIANGVASHAMALGLR